jgi:hypothetical protein
LFDQAQFIYAKMDRVQGASMNSNFRTWAKYLAGAMIVCACSSNNGASSSTGGNSGGQTQSTSSSKGGQTGTSSAGGASGGASSSATGQGGSTTTASSSTGTGGKAGQTTATGGVGGFSTSAKGGTSATSANSSTGTGGGAQGGTTSQSSASVVSSGGSSGADAGASTGKDAAAPDAGATENPRSVLLSDEGNRRVLLMDLQNPSAAVWSRQLNDTTKYGDSMRDLQLVGGDRVAVSVFKGYVELDLKTGEIKKEVLTFTGVESLRRLPNGNTILGSNSEGGVTLQELDPQDTAVSGHKVTFTTFGQKLRLFRRTPQDTFLLGVGNTLAEVNWDKQTVWNMTIPDGDWVFQGLRVDKNIAVTSGYGSAILIIEPTAKKVLTTIGGKSQPDAATIVPNFYAGFQVLSNGHYVVTNWEGHGGGNGTKGIQLLEYDASGTLVWKWKQDSKLVSSLHGAIVLDGLDTTKLHDDVNGALAPVTQ